MPNNRFSIAIALLAMWFCVPLSVHADGTGALSSSIRDTNNHAPARGQLEQATFGLGCYSCAEAMFERLKGVKLVEVGYSGGHVKNPTDEQISSGKTGHAESVHITYDPKVITYADLLKVFWKVHDPTTLNRQGKNVGSQYRSVIFYSNDKQRELAEHYKEKLEAAHVYKDPIVTEITAFKVFYPAAKSHQDFFRLHPKDAYCTLVIQPKVAEFEKVFKDQLQPLSAAKTRQQ